MFPGDNVLRLYCPVLCSATPQADSAPVQDCSVVGLAFCANGSGMLVLMIQSALPAVSALVSSNSTRWTVAAWAAGGFARPTATVAAAMVSVAAAIVAPPRRRVSDIGVSLCE